MVFYSELKFNNNIRLLIGIMDSTIVFSHLIKNEKHKKMLLKCEIKYFTNIKKDKKKLKRIEKKLEGYFYGNDYDPANEKVIYSRGTDFEKIVWNNLKSIKSGQNISYKSLAVLSGFKNSERAVGNAMRKNHLLLFVPCHRVIRSNGEIGNFSAGKRLKEFLLNLEKKER